MILKRTLTVCLSLLPLAGVYAQKDIQQKDVERIVRTLAADDMMGRSTFTPGIEKAATFIANEFKTIGLQPLTGDTDFKQEFKMYSLKIEKADIEINGERVGDEAFFVSTVHRKVEWEEKAPQPVFIGEKDDFRQVMNKVRRAEKDALVMVHPKHEQMFNRYASYFKQPNPVMELGKGHTLVFVLSPLTEVRSFDAEIKNAVTEMPLANVAGMIPGKRTKEYVVFSGHYDHIGIQKPVEGDSIANGADDDASGTTAVISLAKHFKKQGKPERTLIFVAFTAEEIGGYGSQYFSKQLNPDEIVAMFNIEMIGKGSKFGPNSAYITGFEKSDFGTLLQQAVKGTAYSFHPDPYPSQNLFYRSDNATLARLGVPAHTISSVQIDQDKLYHSVNDEVESLDMAHMTNMIKAIALGAKDFVQGKKTPKRVDKTQVQ
ncbi:M20/M25/M40 family metallo-hydrolase [Rufibacter immobilis]|uniref:M20/M25/M40 family metallo-hydrolase n=1 Tax=Rufibacter immobilis TaxID=1348778 RepID=A0A3M9MZF7_9BACT|nr:M20/M25/M40 family metallo-hydrolase [Rufibacter immobilis]RNI30273.1 M20/M25/M40 family metallo-hydrolase [Rufibacter immobilis]